MLAVKPSIRALNRNVIQEVAPYFYDIGIELGLEQELRSIATEYPQQCCRKCQLMFEKFLEKGNATWRAVIDALRFGGVKLLELAAQIEVDLPSLF